MPQSRQRKTGKAKKRPRSLTENKRAGGTTAKNERRVKTILIFLVTAVVASAVAFLVVNRRESQAQEITTASGLKYTDLVQGSGASPQKGQTASVQYIGTLQKDGSKFDSSYDHGKPFDFKFGVDPMIKGWDEGVGTMKVGGKRKLVVPAALGYGNQARPGIPPNSTLVFEIELVSLK